MKSSSRANRLARVRSGSLVLLGMSHVDPRASNALRRNSAVGSSQTAWCLALRRGATRRGQQLEPLGEDRAVGRHRRDVLDDEVEPLRLEPVERLEHHRRGSAEPSFVHVHRCEGVKERSLIRRQTSVVSGEGFYREEPESVVVDQLPSDGGLPCAGCPTDPADVSQPRAQPIGRTRTHLPTIGRAGLPVGASGRRPVRCPDRAAPSPEGNQGAAQVTPRMCTLEPHPAA